ncbi:MAG: PIG-L family deacetylase [Chloroflexota bacterium]|nr:PIG-L family deacetylase [Chloroflexota bacterium]
MSDHQRLGAHMKTRFPRSAVALLVTLGLVFGTLAGPVAARQATPESSPEATPVAEVSSDGSVDLDVLFIGAHPDDEAFGLAAYGQWNEYAGVEVGVITVTRGEGGGNAVGTEEGPALGLLREAEERAAVGTAGIEHIYNLDKVDFYYTVSAPLTEQVWDYEDTLDRVVRVVRATQPEVIITMNPAPTPGNHGHHQVAARLAVDAFYAAADPEAFPPQIEDEGYSTWSVSSIYQNGASGEGQTGPDCATSFVPNEPTDTIFGVWQGTISEANGGVTWGEIAREGQRAYASQGWAVFPDAPTDPAEIQCNYFTLIDSRVPISTNVESTTAMLENTLIDNPRGLPLGTQFYLTTDTFDVLPGQEFTVTAHVAVPDGVDVSASTIELIAPAGWEVVGADDLATQQAEPEAEPAFTVGDDGMITQEFTIVPAADAEPDTRYRIGASFGAGGGIGVTSEVVRVAPAVSGVLEPLPEIAQFQAWTESSDVPQLNNLILPVTSLAIGDSENVDVIVTNNSGEEQSGSVTLELPAGFEADSASQAYDGLAAGESTTVTFVVSNTDETLATSNQGGEEGTYPVTITTESAAGSSTQQAGINLVPSTIVPEASGSVAVDGVITEGEYTGEPLDLSRVWEGDDPDNAADASGTAWLTWDDDGIYVAVEVQDDMLGTVLTPEDAKRHWRTDSVEIAIDPLGTAPNTSATFKVGVFPTSTDGSPQAYRDADAYQGPVAETAPGFEVASELTEPYTGYVLETFIPFDALPADLDPSGAAMNIFIYDSDTEDLTGQTRLGWSTWNGVQGDPYRWGEITLEGYGADAASPAADGATPVSDTAEVDEPIMPLDVAQSTQSPQSIAQSAADGVPLAGRTPVAEGEGLTNVEATVDANGQLTLSYEAGSNGLANYFLVDLGGATIGSGMFEVTAGGPTETTLVTIAGDPADYNLLVSFENEAGAVQALALPVSTAS